MMLEVAITIIPLSTWTAQFPKLPLQKSDVHLKTYTNEPLEVVGEREVTVKYNDQVKKLTIMVVNSQGPSLLGRDWLKYIQLNWPQIANVNSQSQPIQLQELLQEFSVLFQEGLGTVKNFTAFLNLKESAQPKFFRPRPVPFALREGVGLKLDRLEEAGIIEEVHSLQLSEMEIRDRPHPPINYYPHAHEYN